MKDVKDFGDRAADNLIELKAHVEQKRAEPVQQINGEIKTDAPSTLKRHLTILTGKAITEGTASIPQVRGLGIDRGNVVGLVGMGGAGKTLIIPVLSTAIAQGGDFLGHTCEKGTVVIVGAEAPDSLRQRLASYWKREDIDPDSLNIHIIPHHLDLCHSDVDVHALVKLIRGAGITKVDALFIDTHSKTMGGGDENSSKDAGAWVMNSQTLQEKLDGCSLFIVCHLGKDEGKSIRGNSLLKYHTEVLLLFRKNKDEPFFDIELDRTRDAAPGTTWRLDITEQQINWGGDLRMRPVAVWNNEEGKVTRGKQRRLTTDDQTAMRAVGNLIATDGKSLQGSEYPTGGVLAVSLSDWQEEAYRDGFYPSIKRTAAQDERQFADARRKAFGRTISKLRDMGRICMRNDMVWIIHQRRGTRADV